MSKLQLMSAGLIATAMLVTPALAREHQVRSQHRVENINADPAPGLRDDERSCIRAPRVGAFATAPWDTAPPCEARLGY